MKNKQNKKIYFSPTWGIEVRPSIAKEFTYDNKFFDENLAGLHEVRSRLNVNKNYGGDFSLNYPKLG